MSALPRSAPGVDGRRVNAIAVLLGVVVGVGVVLTTGVLALSAPGRGAARVELLVYSGHPNPSFELTPVETDELVRRLDRLPGGAALPEGPGLGYSGLVVTFAGASGTPDRVTAYRGVRLETADGAANRLDTEGVETWLIDLARQRGQAEVLAALGL